jgi:uncharacterized protein YdhG (YjbR/CyaY superfamily)
MTSRVPDVPNYIDQAPGERREFLHALRVACRDKLVGFEETMDYGMPSYKRAGEVEVAFASRARYVAQHPAKRRA